MKGFSTAALLVLGIALGSIGAAKALAVQSSQPASLRVNIPYADAKPIIEVLREDLLPVELRGKTAAELEPLWPDWVARRDAIVRARVEQGEEDSVVHVLLYGTMFTKEPLATELAAPGATDAVLRLLHARIDDFVAALSAPGGNERLEFARHVLTRKGIDPATEDGRNQMRRYLEERALSLWQTAAQSQLTLLNDPVAESVDRRTLFRDRGLTFNTSLFVNLAVEQALAAIKADGLLHPGAVHRVAVIGPGLEFTEKQDGYDFYAPQTIQPFAIIDSLIRLGLSTPADLQVTAFDVSPRIIQHLEAARARAQDGRPYAVVLPRNLDRPWTPAVVSGWERFGTRIGDGTTAMAPPQGADRVAVRRVLVRPSLVLSTMPRDLNIVLQRLESAAAHEAFDLILATNVLIYYDVFDQLLASANIAKMLRPGGFFLSNDPIFELPDSSIRSVGGTEVTYMALPGIGGAGDRIVWYRRY